MELITADYPIARLEHDGGVVSIGLPLSPSVLFVAVPWHGKLASADDSELKRFGEFAWHFSVLVNLLLISQGPNYLYSKRRLEDGVQRLRKAADDTLKEPEEKRG